MTTVDILDHYEILEWLLFAVVWAIVYVAWQIRRLGTIIRDGGDEGVGGPVR